MSRGRCVLWIIVVDLIILAIAAAVGLGLMYSGTLYVGADKNGPAAVDWFLGNASDRSVSRHAREVKVPALDDPAMAREGFGHYREMCAMCHGRPGAHPGLVGKGLNPGPPDLVDSAKEMEPAELFYWTKHGVRMTGMPSWGITHTDAQLWDIVAFLKTLPNLTAEQYQAMARQQPAGEHMGE